MLNQALGTSGAEPFGESQREPLQCARRERGSRKHGHSNHLISSSQESITTCRDSKVTIAPRQGVALPTLVGWKFVGIHAPASHFRDFLPQYRPSHVGLRTWRDGATPQREIRRNLHDPFGLRRIFARWNG